MCQGNPGRCRHGGQSRDSRHDLERNPRLGQRERLLTPTPEHERIASLQPNDVEALPGELDEQSVDLLLADPVARDGECVRGRLGHELRGHEPVVDERIAIANEFQPARRDQTGVAGAGADKPDGQERASDTSCSK